MGLSHLQVEIFSLVNSLVQSHSIGPLNVSVYRLAILPPPGDVGVGNPGSFTDEAGVVFLPDGDGAGTALLVNDGGGHHHVQVAGLGDHGVRVDLAHIVTLVLGLDVLDVKGPGVVTVVDDVEPGDPGDDVPPYGEDHLAVYVDPGNLDTSGEGGVERGRDRDSPCSRTAPSPHTSAWPPGPEPS